MKKTSSLLTLITSQMKHLGEIRNLNLYQTSEIRQSVFQDTVENLNMRENPTIHFQFLKNILEDRDEKSSSELASLGSNREE